LAHLTLPRLKRLIGAGKLLRPQAKLVRENCWLVQVAGSSSATDHYGEVARRATGGYAFKASLTD
jgi:hypothetical protein